MAEQERKPTRLWGGRFESGPAEALARLSVSVQFDWRLAPYDLLASAAHARVLHQAGLLDDDELARLLAALDGLSRACRNGEFRPAASDEDVHTALERGLLERLGTLGVVVMTFFAIFAQCIANRVIRSRYGVNDTLLNEGLKGAVNSDSVEFFSRFTFNVTVC